jgi:hypothetical protein
MKYSFLPGVLCFSLWGCASSEKALIEGTTAHVSVSSAFEYMSGMRVAVLPITATGSPDREQDISEADIFCTQTSEADIEDLFEIDFYLDLVNGAYREDLAKGHLRGSGVRITEFISQVLKSMPMKNNALFDRCVAARFFAANSSKFNEQISKETFALFERNAKALNALKDE